MDKLLKFNIFDVVEGLIAWASGSDLVSHFHIPLMQCLVELVLFAEGSSKLARIAEVGTALGDAGCSHLSAV
jgi:hypothetical protein